VIIGGGDTGADCLGTAHRQGAASVTQLEILPAPPENRPNDNPWPQWSMVFRTSSAHEEGGERVFSVNTERFVDDDNGNVRALLLHEVALVEGRFQKIEGASASCRRTTCSSRWASSARAGAVARAARRRVRPARQRRAPRRLHDHGSRACSSPATWAAVRA
jgi:NADPH-dependent glutamate synthase beta subunit-like oxidoreductase